VLRSQYVVPVGWQAELNIHGGNDEQIEYNRKEQEILVG
jgi:hypothetical protein